MCEGRKISKYVVVDEEKTGLDVSTKRPETPPSESG
jgi:hypothetical protein